MPKSSKQPTDINCRSKRPEFIPDRNRRTRNFVVRQLPITNFRLSPAVDETLDGSPCNGSSVHSFKRFESRVSFRYLVHFTGHRRAQPIPSLRRHTRDKGHSNPTKHLHFSLVILLHLDVHSDVAEDSFSLRVYTKETV